MNTVQVKVKYLRNTLEQGNRLEYATSASAGVDLRAFMDEESIVLEPGTRHAFPTGIAIEITRPDLAGFVFSRSGLGTKQGLVVSQGVGVIDPDYRGEIIVSLLNNSRTAGRISKGQRIAQLVFMPWFQARFTPVQELTATDRGQGGFGHTGSS